MNSVTKNLSQRLNQTQPQIKGNARAYKEFGCSSTPAPTPPVSVSDNWKAVVGAGLYNNQIVGAGAGVRMEEVKIKDEVKVKVESQNKSQKKHRGKPPVVSLTGRAGFSTPFPEGLSSLGPFYFLNLIGEVGYDRAQRK